MTPVEEAGCVVFAEVAADGAAGVVEPACLLGAIVNVRSGK